MATDNIPLLGLAPNTVSLCPHEPMWRQCYLDEEQAIIDVLGPDILRLEHIGSTCIPHIMAKPTIDMAGGIRSFEDVPGLIAPLGGLGYEYLGEGIVQGHHVFGKGTFRTHLLHIVELGGVRWRELRAFRDLLKQDREIAARYEQLKLELSIRFENDRRGYREAKRSFIDGIVATLIAGDQSVVEPTIRDAARADLRRIVDIYNASISSRRSVGETRPITVKSRLGWFNQHSPARRPVWVLELETVIGWLSLQSFGPLKAFARTAELSLFIAPEHQRQGYGSLLLSKLIDDCPRLGVSTLIGTCFAHNEATLRLNRRFGFEQWGIFPGIAQLDGTPRDLVFMGLKI